MTGSRGSDGGPGKSISGAGQSGGADKSGSGPAKSDAGPARSGGRPAKSGSRPAGSGAGPAKSGVDLRERLRAEQLDAVSWSNGAGDRYGAHEHSYDKVIAVEAGSIRFNLPGLGEDAGVDLALGDRLELPAGTSHAAIVGPAGVTCLEAHLPAGSFPDIARRAADDW